MNCNLGCTPLSIDDLQSFEDAKSNNLIRVGNEITYTRWSKLITLKDTYVCNNCIFLLDRHIDHLIGFRDEIAHHVYYFEFTLSPFFDVPDDKLSEVGNE